MRTLELPDALRRYGVEPVLVAGWATRGNEYPARPQGGLRHWTAGATTGRTPSLGVVTSGRSDLPGPLCAVLQSREAPGTRDKAYVIASGKSNHAGAGNWHGLDSNYELLGLEIEWSGPNEPFSAARQDVSERIMAAFLDVCHATDNRLVAEHREYALPAGRKPDTNLDGNVMRQRMVILRSTPPPTPEDDMKPPTMFTLFAPAAPSVGHVYLVQDGGIDAHHLDGDAFNRWKAWGATDKTSERIPATQFHCLDGPLATP